MVFDVLAWDAKNQGNCVSYVQKTFKERQDLFVNHVLARYAKGMESMSADRLVAT